MSVRHGVADVAVVGPHETAGVGTVVVEEAVEDIGHVAVADVPRLAVGTQHRPVVALAAGEHGGVLHGVELGLKVGGLVADVLAFARLPVQCAEQVDHLVLARRRHQSGGPGVGLRVLAVGLEHDVAASAAGTASGWCSRR
jgi:hypothetical protein